jgi:uncharacterized membrane protein YoaK (UPF0700 family)
MSEVRSDSRQQLMASMELKLNPSASMANQRWVSPRASTSLSATRRRDLLQTFLLILLIVVGTAIGGVLAALSIG